MGVGDDVTLVVKDPAGAGGAGAALAGVDVDDGGLDGLGDGAGGAGDAIEDVVAGEGLLGELDAGGGLRGVESRDDGGECGERGEGCDEDDECGAGGGELAHGCVAP